MTSNLPSRTAIVLHDADDVAVATDDLEAGDLVSVLGGARERTIVVREKIPFGHKFSLRPMKAGADVRKYGEVIGCLTGYFLQYYVSAISYPLNVGGRPLNSWPAFVPVTFEVTVLIAAFVAVLGMLARNGLPRPHHPLFNSTRFGLATKDRFFLCIEAIDPKFDREATQQFLAGLHARHIEEVPD